MTHPAHAGESPLPPLVPGPHRKRIGLISIVACFGGLLFGYDTGVSNGAEQPMQIELGLSDLSLGVVISSLVFAAAVGALFGGQVSDVWGRRKTIILLAVLFFVGTLFVVFSPGFGLLVTGRILLGLAVGGASTVVPVYLAELAPLEIRGSITGRNELAIVTGQLAAFVMNAIIGTAFGHIDGVWRLMFSICALPAIALFVGMLRMPESPRWLVEKGRHDHALEVLKTVRSEARAVAELDEVKRVAEEEKAEHRVGMRAILANKWLVRILLVGIGVAMAQQLTGINAIMYYGQRVLIEAGFTADAALVANISAGVFAVIGGVIALRNMDRLDRRKTFAIGLSLTTTCHVLIGIAALVL
ncbi:MAG: sugar porter family MFS transporter, partial [Pseudonocardia sp.]|nr:sugar porter family MFS transporter [Pseudonocardia sp.]